VTTIDDVLDQIRESSETEKEKGDKFERLMLAFFRIDPTYARQFSNVWMWNDWPDNQGSPDIGIDLVAENAGGDGYTAIQCKCYAPTTTLDKGDIDSFFTESGKAPFTHRIIVCTTNLWSQHAEKALTGQDKPVRRIGVEALDSSTIDWSQWDLNNLDEDHRHTQSLLSLFSSHKSPLMQGRRPGEPFGDRDEQSTETQLMWSGKDPTHLDSVAVFPDFELLRDKVARFGNLLPQFQIGLDGLRLEPNWDLKAWLQGTPVFLEALDQPSGDWVKATELSEAQQRWVLNVLAIGDAQENNEPLAIVADEVDAGVHVSASTSIFRALSEIPGIGFASSHSPTALRTPLARLMHVQRDGTGQIRVSRPGLAVEAESAADSLGVDLTDLLATKYLAVIVEGKHDSTVIEGLLKGEPALERLVLIEGRGTKNMKAIPDASLLVDYSDLRILVIVDNARNEKIQPVLDTLKKLLGDHRGVKQAMKLSGFADLRSKATPEERTIVEIIDRAARRRVIDRVGVYGLPVRDIAQLLPPESFGLDHDWPHLEHEFKQERSGRDFKTWLREEHGVSISVKTIRKAVSGLDELSDGLVDLRESVIVALALATRDRGLPS